MAAPVVVLRGKSSSKCLYGRGWRRVTPCVVVEKAERGGRIVLGLIFSETKGLQWGPSPLSQAILPAWHAMKFAENFNHIYLGVACACWHVATPDLGAEGARYAEELAGYIGSEGVQMLRQQALSSYPSPDEIDAMIRGCLRANVHIDDSQLEVEARAKRIAYTPSVRGVIHRQTNRAHRTSEENLRRRWRLPGSPRRPMYRST